MLKLCLQAKHQCLVLTNAMRPMQRPLVQAGLLALHKTYGAQLRLRVSLDHYTRALHDTERGAKSWDSAMAGCDWLAENKIEFSVAGRLCWGESEADTRAGFATLFAKRGWSITAEPKDLVLFPEMETETDVPEITTECWGILNVSPDSPMCATARMIGKRKGADKPAVLACTLLPYDARFEMGNSLRESQKPIALNHPHCARFCVLGGASCSG